MENKYRAKRGRGVSLPPNITPTLREGAEEEQRTLTQKSETFGRETHRG